MIAPLEHITKNVSNAIDWPIPLGISKPSMYSNEYWTTAKSSQVLDLKKAINKRDHHTCRFCGFHNAKYQEVVFKNGCEWDLDNAYTACIFCAECFSLDHVYERRSGVLVFLPEIPQIKLNQLLKIMYVARISQTEQASIAKKTLDAFMLRRKPAADKLTDDPAVLADKLASCKTKKEAERLQEIIKDFRFFPLDRRIIKEADLEFNQFPQILAHWRSKNGAFGGLPPREMDFNEINTIAEYLINNPMD